MAEDNGVDRAPAKHRGTQGEEFVVEQSGGALTLDPEAKQAMADKLGCPTASLDVVNAPGHHPDEVVEVQTSVDKVGGYNALSIGGTLTEPNGVEHNYPPSPLQLAEGQGIAARVVLLHVPRVWDGKHVFGRQDVPYSEIRKDGTLRISGHLI